MDLDNVLHEFQNFLPIPELAELYKRKALKYYESGNFEFCAAFLSCSHGLYLLHKKKLKEEQLFMKEGNELLFVPSLNLPTDSLEHNIEKLSISNKTEDWITPIVQDFHDTVSFLPKEWCIIQLTAAPRSKPLNCIPKIHDSKVFSVTTEPLFLTRLQNGKLPLIRLIEQPEDCNILQDLQDILASSYQINQNERVRQSRKEYWEFRNQIDERMKSLLSDICKHWLGPWRFLFVPPFCQNSLNVKLFDSSKLSPIQLIMMQVLVENRFVLDEKDISEILTSILKCNIYDKVYNNWLSWFKKLSNENEERGHVVLVLDREYHCIPWEVISCLQDYSVSRLPCIQFLKEKLNANVYPVKINPDSLFYVINPGNDLPGVEKRMTSYIKKHNKWHGYIGSFPENSNLSEHVAKHDLYLYCGHGSGSKYLPVSTLDHLQSNVSPLLMGCNSCNLIRIGQCLEPFGIPIFFLTAGSHAALGFLYEVTDKDCDRITIDLLKFFIEDGLTLTHAVRKARKSARMFLTAAAIVVYGLPISVDGYS